MATLSAKKIQEALKKAQKVGRHEEPVTIDGCALVLQSLRPDEYAVLQAEIEEIPEGIAYLIAFKKEHICRSICEFNGVDLREVEFVEVDVEDVDERTKKPVVKTIKVERHVFVRDYVIGSWGREAVDVAFRKFNEVITAAEKKAAEGVVFVIPEETPEEKYRKLLAEAKEIEGHLPIDLSAKIREDLGYISKTTQAEYEAATEGLSKIQEPEPEAEQAPPEPESPPPQPTPRARPAQAAPVPRNPYEAPPRMAKPIPHDAQPTPEEIMQARQPLNQRDVDIPVPVPAPAVPPQAMAANPLVPATPAVLKKSAEIAAMEGAVGFEPQPALQGGTQLAAGGAVPGNQIVAATPGMERTPMEITRPFQKVDPTKAEQIFEQPPTGGINPRFRKPPQQF